MPHADCCNDRSDLLNKSITMVSNEVITELGPAQYRHLSPEEEIERSKKLLGLKGAGPVRLTVGDQSWVTKEKARNRIRDGLRLLRNMKDGLTVGDLSFHADQAIAAEEKRLYEEYAAEYLRNKAKDRA